MNLPPDPWLVDLHHYTQYLGFDVPGIRLSDAIDTRIGGNH